MIVSIIGRSCYVYRQDGDPVFRPTKSDSSWSAPWMVRGRVPPAPSRPEDLNQRGYDLIKKQMWKDGHMVGTEFTQYLRSRDIQRVQSLCIYHANHAVEIAAELFNKIGLVELAVEYGLAEDDDGPESIASRDIVLEDRGCPPLLRGLVDRPRRPRQRRHDKRNGTIPPLQGLHGPGQAPAFLTTDPGEYPRLINRLTGERITSVVRLLRLTDTHNTPVETNNTSTGGQ